MTSNEKPAVGYALPDLPFVRVEICLEQGLFAPKQLQYLFVTGH